MQRMDLIGHNYTEPTAIRIFTGGYICAKGNKLVVRETSFCMADIHYFVKDSKEPIPVDTIVEVNHCFANFEGHFINVTYKDKNYDVKVNNLRYDSNVCDKIFKV